MSKSSIEFCMDAIEDMRKEPDELIAKYQDTLWSIFNELDVIANGVDKLQAENERLRDALKEIMRSPKCNNPSCTIDNPLCNTMIAVAALKGGDE